MFDTWGALDALSSIAGKGGVHNRMKGNGQRITKSALRRDMWTPEVTTLQTIFFNRNSLSATGSQCFVSASTCS